MGKFGQNRDKVFQKSQMVLNVYRLWLCKWSSSASGGTLSNKTVLLFMCQFVYQLLLHIVVIELPRLLGTNRKSNSDNVLTHILVIIFASQIAAQCQQNSVHSLQYKFGQDGRKGLADQLESGRKAEAVQHWAHLLGQSGFIAKNISSATDNQLLVLLIDSVMKQTCKKKKLI